MARAPYKPFNGKVLAALQQGPASIRELAARAGVEYLQAWYVVRRLKKAGKVKRIPERYELRQSDCI